MGRLVAVLAACLLLAGCSPATTRAVRLGDSGLPEIIDTSCESRMLTLVEIRAMNADDVLDERDTVIWRIEFAQPRQHYKITVGQVPEGAEEKVAWQPPAGDQLLDVGLQNGDLHEPGDSFTLDQLKDGKVKYRYELLTAEEFAKKDRSC
ncbi:hypothetical protein [Lentzea flava]|uniref:Lipoprotein n=1 Tax=Lentzea flava TaxID=103732 RepID=A0ABQ2UZ74_9PSEU|nr:hypothetical protein [Lentzea flava]MCP2202418.1 hypothetical protein [Lentzea flava]GGU61278.1 hypothetical protein GCM10010178_61940 [Lentzea flava]